MLFGLTKKYALSVVLIFFNMRREARRTLYTLTKAYQQHTGSTPYEVIVIDNGSTEPLERSWVESHGKNFRYIYFDATTPSPAAALNYGAEIASAKYITLCIDGARMFSPGIVCYTMLATQIYANPLVYTLAMHLGPKPQKQLVAERYTQAEEDASLAAIDWQMDGYSLFNVSCVAPSSGGGYFSKLTESNCLTLLRSTYQKMGGYDQRFTSAGGGLANIDFFNRAQQLPDVNPVILLGEATFHQMHGGVATGSVGEHMPNMVAEYEHIHHTHFQPCWREPIYFGRITAPSARFLNRAQDHGAAAGTAAG